MARLRALVQHAAPHARRGQSTHDDVPDPYGRDATAVTNSYNLINDAVATIVRAVTAP